MKYLVVVDVQKDFVDGALGSAEAQKVVPAIIDKVKKFDGKLVFTRDTHEADYLQTQEGKNLPVVHCVEDTDGWQIVDELDAIRQERNAVTFDKTVFGSVSLAHYMANEEDIEPIDEIELIGLDTDICVISNALLIKSALPEIPIYVDAKCCAGTSVENHKKALDIMKICQIYVRGE